MKLTFCAACGSRNDLQHHHLTTRGEAGDDDERNLITLCGSCYAKLDKRQAPGAAAAAERARTFAERLRPTLSHSRVCRPPLRPKSWRAGASPRLMAAAGRRAQ